MTRNNLGIFDGVWAESGDVETPASQGVDTDTGFDADFDPGGSKYPRRQTLNYLLRQLYALGVELNRMGALLPWSPLIDYMLHARVLGSDGRTYRCVAPTGPATGNVQNPVTRPDNTIWSDSTGGIGDGDVTADKLRDGSVTTPKFAAGAVLEALGNGVITADHLGNGAVTGPKIRNGVIDGSKLADNLRLPNGVTAPTPDTADNSEKVATTEYVTSKISAGIDLSGQLQTRFRLSSTNVKPALDASATGWSSSGLNVTASQPYLWMAIRLGNIAWSNVSAFLIGHYGRDGQDGATGARGPAGNDGATGARGPAGNDGATGARGPRGYQGSSGSRGPQGETGPPGNRGATGPAGARGPEGPAGARGPEGPAGARGPEGPAGRDGSDATADGVVTGLSFSRVAVSGNHYRYTITLSRSNNLPSLSQSQVIGG